MAKLQSNQFQLSKQDNIILEIQDYPEISFFVVDFEIPGITTGVTTVSNPFTEYNFEGSKLTFEPIELTMVLAENLQNWLAIRDWILEGNNGTTFKTSSISKKLGNIIVTNNNSVPIFNVVLIDMFPTTLSAVNIDVQQAEPVPPTFNATFYYTRYDVSVAS